MSQVIYKGTKMYTTFESLVNKVKTRTLDKLGQELAADIVAEVKTLGPDQKELRRELNKRRIDALGLKLIKGGKDER